MGRVNGTPKVFGVLDEDERDDDTATTAMLTDLDEMDSDSEGDSDDGEDFAMENAPRPPPETPLYGGNGKLNKRPRTCMTPRAEGRDDKAARGRPPRTKSPRRPGMSARGTAPRTSILVGREAGT